MLKGMVCSGLGHWGPCFDPFSPCLPLPVLATGVNSSLLACLEGVHCQVEESA